MADKKITPKKASGGTKKNEDRAAARVSKKASARASLRALKRIR